MEIYKIVVGFENYAVSTLGNVKSVRTNRVLKPDVSNINIDGVGYKRVTFSNQGKIYRFSIHRLVAKAFIENPENKLFVNHIDNDPSNNEALNLEWCTHSENMLHCVKTGRSTYSVAAKKTAEAKRGRKELLLRGKLGIKFISMNPGEQSTVTYACDECNKHCTVRLDSSALRSERTMCKPCSYKFR